MKKHESIVKDELIEKSFEGIIEDRLFRVAINNIDIQQQMCVAGLFCPNFVEVHGYVFLDERVVEKKWLDIWESKGQSKKDIEMSSNVMTIKDLFMIKGLTDKQWEDKSLIENYFDMLKYFWQQRLDYLFPDKEFIVIVGSSLGYENDDYCISFYQNNRE